jgi:dynactin complex subunit
MSSYAWQATGGPKCPGCGQLETINQYKHIQWRCGSRWTDDEKTDFLQSNRCQRHELDTLHAKIKQLTDNFESYKKEIKRQEAFKYIPPVGIRLKD